VSDTNHLHLFTKQYLSDWFTNRVSAWKLSQQVAEILKHIPSQERLPPPLQIFENMTRIPTSFLFVVVVLCILKVETSVAFVNRGASSPTPVMKQETSSTTLYAESPCSRRDAFLGIAAAAFAATGAVANPSPASAKYSDYSRREQDWQARQSKGEIKFSSAKDLRRQLAEIVPANSEASKVFCPNGPSAAVSPLMENKCSDTRMALPSVYGRSNDVMGNSIPGFQSGYDWSSGGGSSISAASGGFPGYYSKK
jgi:hypothetical protein